MVGSVFLGVSCAPWAVITWIPGALPLPASRVSRNARARTASGRCESAASRLHGSRDPRIQPVWCSLRYVTRRAARLEVQGSIRYGAPCATWRAAICLRCRRGRSDHRRRIPTAPACLVSGHLSFAHAPAGAPHLSSATPARPLPSLHVRRGRATPRPTPTQNLFLSSLFLYTKKNKFASHKMWAGGSKIRFAYVRLARA
jgi:hypothetical protein